MNNDYKNIILKNINTEPGLSSAKAACPLCNALMDYEFDLLAKLQYEIHNNESVRKKVAEEGGFCDFHFRQFKKIASGLTNILLLKSLVESDSYKKESFNIECRLCNQIDSFENALIIAQYELFKDDSFKHKFSDTIGLCFVHFNKIISISDDAEIDKWLKEIHIDQIKRTKEEFDFMLRFKSFYEIDREKRKLINIMIEKFAGRKTHAL
ncbi:MAG: hypothetical protein ACYCVH_07265 [Ignavibacteriaceae bacterium]